MHECVPHVFVVFFTKGKKGKFCRCCHVMPHYTTCKTIVTNGERCYNYCSIEDRHTPKLPAISAIEDRHTAKITNVLQLSASKS